MPRLPSQKIDEIRQSVDIVEVIGSYLPLQKKGRNYTTICPFHDDSNPSLSISQSKQIYMCFVCHNGGNVFTFLKEYLHISYGQAISKVASIGHVDIGDYHIDAPVKKIDEKLQPLYQMQEEASKIYGHYLQTKSGLAAKEYLHKRGINDAIIETFQIGYSVPRSILLTAFQKQDFSLLDMYKSGLIIESKTNQDRFRDRIMFPIHNKDGSIIGFSGRVFHSRNPDEAKYMNSPESPIFNKGNILFNYHRAIDSARKEGFIILCEGFMDVIAWHRAGQKNVVALMGTALTTEHLSDIRRLSNDIYLCMDGDEAGQKATLKMIELLEKNQFSVHIIALPLGSDPDEIEQQKGSTELLSMVKHAEAPIPFLMQYYYSHTNMENYEEKKAYLEKMIELIRTIDDPIDQEYYAGLLEKKSGFEKETILRSLQTLQQDHRISFFPIARSYGENRQLIDKYVQAEKSLLYYMLEDKEVSLRYEQKLGFMYNEIYHIIACYIVDYYREHATLEIADLINSIENDKIVQNIIDISQLSLRSIKDNEENKVTYDFSPIDDYIETIKQRAVIAQKNDLKKTLHETFDPIQKAKILQEIIALKES